MAEFFMCLECQLQPPFVIMWLKLAPCHLHCQHFQHQGPCPKKNYDPYNDQVTITIQHVIFMEWLHFTIHQFFKSAMQGISSLSSRWAIARASYCYVLILWRNLFQPPSIFDLQYLPIYLNPASVPGPEQDSVCSVLYASRRVKTCFSIESCEEAPRDSINGALLTPPPASQPGHYIYPSANSLRQQMPPKNSILLKWKSKFLKKNSWFCAPA